MNGLKNIISLVYKKEVKRWLDYAVHVPAVEENIGTKRTDLAEQGRTKINGWKLKPDKFKLKTVCTFLTARVINYWNK